jgi:hypothetical protein
MMAKLLHQFVTIFAKPMCLPPQWDISHRIHLLPSTAPVAVRPYRYAHGQKLELKQKCADMLQVGIIRPSMSTFSVPVLLVKKSDGSWQFCVDYRALNSRTLKDKLLIPVVGELLDEFRGAALFTKLDLQSGYH